MTDHPELVLVGMAFGVVAAILASRKHRNPLGWFVIGWLLPLIGLILIIVLPEGTHGKRIDLDLKPAGYAIPSPQEAALDALGQLAALRDRGALSPEEFEDKKRELLSRV